MNSICGHCAWRSTNNVNQWNEQPQNTCLNTDSFKYRRPVTKGMTCNKFEKEQEAA